MTKPTKPNHKAKAPKGARVVKGLPFGFRAARRPKFTNGSDPMTKAEAIERATLNLRPIGMEQVKEVFRLLFDRDPDDADGLAEPYAADKLWQHCLDWHAGAE